MPEVRSRLSRAPVNIDLVADGEICSVVIDAKRPII